MILRLALVLALLAMGLPRATYAQFDRALKPDETVVLFPTSGALDPDGGGWIVPLRGWVFEPEPGSLWRAAFLKAFALALGLDPSAIENALFRQRARLFLADNERGKQLELRLLDRVFPLEPSTPNGHFRGGARLARADVPPRHGPLWLASEIVAPDGDARRFTGALQLVPPEGLSIISDLDDTIKISQVTDKQALLENTFLKPFAAVPGMAAAYQGWARDGAAFHYLSASPWQLYPPLSEFATAAGFPPGSFHLKTFRLKDESFLDLFAAPEDYKVPAIEAIIRRYPQRRFVLVGDSGEKDPEIYGTVARRFPTQVRLILIRDLPEAPSPVSRYEAAFKDVPRNRWRLFRDAAILEELAVAP